MPHREAIGKNDASSVARSTGSSSVLETAIVRWGAGIAALIVLAAVGVWRLRGFIADDAFILYRYADNIAAGEGWTYNVGTTTANAATSTLYTLLLAGASAVTGRTQAAGTVLTVLGLVGAALATFAALARLGDRAAGHAAAVLVVTSPWLLSTRGMETPLLLAFVAAALWATADERPVLVGVALGLALLTRADGVALALPVLAWWWVRTKRIPVVPAAIVASCAVASALFGWVVVGSPVSNTLAGKVAQAESGFWGDGPLFLKGFVDMPRLFGFGWWMVVVLVLAAAGLLAGVMRPATRGFSVTIASMALLHAFAYGVVLRPPAYHWYYGVEIYAAVVFAGIGCGFVWSWFGERVVPASLVLAGVALLGLAATPEGYRYQAYDDASGWVVQNTSEDSTVAATEIGVIGYRTGRPIVDYLGLIDEQAVHELRDGDLASWMARTRPDVWIVHNPPWSFELPAMATDEFRQQYELVEQTPTYTIYRRRLTG